MVSLTICSAAEDDFTESLRWYAEHSVEAANDFDAEFDRALEAIARAPERFPQCDERHRYFLMRRFPFQVIYRVQGEQIAIIAVAHTSRSPDFWSHR
jgi:plasmid stabilization system protein ParE